MVSRDKASGDQTHYLVEDGILMPRWVLKTAPDKEWNYVNQIVVPTVYHPHIRSVAHESKWSGLLGVTKTYHLILRHFFWPGLKSDVVMYCRSCHICQLAGKPNQVIPPATLHPISTVGETFQHVLIDCVGPIPRTKSSNQYLLIIMCAATRFPEAIPMRNITARSIVKT